MICSFEFILAILIPMILMGIVSIYARRKNKDKLPPGSYVIDTPLDSIEEKAPGTTWSRYGGVIGHWIGDLSIFTSLIIYLLGYIIPSLDLWRYFSPLVIDLPIWLNWIGIVGEWFCLAFGASVLIYNVNFTPCTQPMKARYVLATGGPYRFVRHPVYLGESLGTIFAFLATGVWLNVFGVISWFALLDQAKAEEVFLERRFGKIYVDYKEKTGRFFPKV
jgi:protein-S-isoprenylcysteine O-methyltransferase Ste14